MNWKEKLDPLVKTHLDRQILESIRHKNAYEIANNPALAQLWTALASISKDIFEINLRLKNLEGNLKSEKEMSEKNIKKKN